MKNKKNTLFNINLNYFTKKPIRQIIVEGKNISINANLIKNKIIYVINDILKEKKFSIHSLNYTYKLQHESIINKKLLVCKLSEGLNVMKIIDDIKNFKN